MLERRFSTGQLGIFDLAIAKERARSRDRDGAIEILRIVVDDAFATSYIIQLGTSVTALVETLLERGTNADKAEAQAATERLAAVPVEPGFVLYDVTLLRLAGTTGSGPRRGRRLPRLRRSLPHYGDIARFRGAYGDGRDDGRGFLRFSARPQKGGGS